VFGRIADTIHASIYGSVAVALVQGALGGVMFWVLGLPTPVFWGFVMALLALVPMLGTFLRVDSDRRLPCPGWSVGQGSRARRVGCVCGRPR
jgi:hypothetical protein